MQSLENQACYLRDQFTAMLEKSSSADTKEHLGFAPLLKALNRFLTANGEKAIACDACHLSSAVLGAQLVQFMNEMNHTKNPMNSELPYQQMEAFNQQMALLYEAIAEYLQTNHIPIERKGVSVESYGGLATPLELWKKHQVTHADGSVEIKTEKVDAIDYSRKALICFGGTTSVQGYHPAGFIRLAESKLGGPDIYASGIDVYAVSYPAAHRAAFFADTHRYNADPDHYCSPAARHFTETLILPMLDICTTTQELKTCMGKLNFFAYSYGTVFTQEIRNCLKDALRQRHFGSEAIKSALAEVFAMHIGPTCRLDVSHADGNFSSMYVLSPKDLSVRSKTNNIELVKHLNYSKKRVRALNDNELVIYSESPEEGEIEGSRKMDGHIPAKNTSGHDLKFYTHKVTHNDGCHTPHYVNFCLSKILGARQDIADARFNPPCPSELPEFASTTRAGFDTHDTAYLNEIARSDNIAR